MEENHIPSSSTSRLEQFCPRLSVAKIRLATRNFHKDHVIGVGGFGKVYKCLIDSDRGPMMVAVKRLIESDSRQGMPEFLNEIETLSKLRHRHIVSLIGYCKEQGELLLVYEYIANGTLADTLSKRRNSRSPLTWNERLTICIGVARGLDHLHNGNSGTSILHRDVKSTNILLDETFAAKVSDFGLAKHLEENSDSHVSKYVKFSPGYLDPFTSKTGIHTIASDVYAFGVVLLEVLSEKPTFDSKLPVKQQLLSDRAHDKIRNGKLKLMAASSLRGGVVSKASMEIYLKLVIGCLDPDPGKRPTMTKAVAELESARALQQQHKRKTNLIFNPFRTRVTPSGSTHEDHNQVDADIHPEDIQEDASEHELTGDMLPVAIPTIPDDELEDIQNATTMLSIAVPAIQMSELKEITDEFSLNNLIDDGSSGGSLFHGVLHSGQHAAIKRLNEYSPDQAFLEQVSILSSLKNENVVHLLGYCVDEGEQVLAYEYAPRGSLHAILHGRQETTEGLAMDPGQYLSWPQRIKIAVGAAKGLVYIHRKELVHRNTNSRNVLLFDDDIAKITDIRLQHCDYTDPFTLTSGQHPPECGCNGQSQKGDIYGFGVVLLELLTGRKLFDPTLSAGVHLVEWATPMLSVDKVHEIVDARLVEGDYPRLAVEKMAECAGLCLGKEADFRPAMSIILKGLQVASWETQIYLRKHSQ